MGFGADLSKILFQKANPVQVHADNAVLTGFLNQPIAPAPDAKPLSEVEEVHAVVARCINVIAEDASSVPLKLFDISGKQPKEVTDHEAIHLFRHINSVETPSLWMQNVFADLLSEGNHFSWCDRDSSGIPMNLVRMPPHQVKVIESPTEIIGGYIWEPQYRKPNKYRRDDVIHMRTRNPHSIYRGLGLLVRLRDQIHLERSMRAWNHARFSNGVQTQVIIEAQRQFINPQEFERFREELWDKMRGVQNAGKPMVVRQGEARITVIPRPTEEELAFLASLKYTRNEFAMLFGVPPSRLSDYSESFRANASDQAKSFWEDTIMTWHRTFLDWMNSVIGPRYWREWRTNNGQNILEFQFDYSQIRALAPSTKQLAEVNAILVQNGMRTPNEGRASMGIPRHEDENADELYVNGQKLGATPAGALPADFSIEDDSEEDTRDDQNSDEEDAGGAASSEDKRLLESSQKQRPFIRVVPGDLLDPEEEAERVAKATKKLIREMVRRAALEEIELSGLLGSFNVNHPEVLSAIERQTIAVSNATVKTTNEMVRRTIAEFVRDGASASEMRRGLRAVFKERRADWRLDTIARTETHQAQEIGGLHAMKQNGVEFKEWITTLDGRERTEHRNLDGSVVPIDAKFQNGLLHPGDTANAQDPSDVINCRCIKVANFKNLVENVFHKSIDKKEAWTKKNDTRMRFETAFKLHMRRLFFAMEKRALASLEEQLRKVEAA